MKWDYVTKLAHAEGTDSFSITHAMIPTPVIINENILRVYYSSQDSKGIARPRFTDYSITNDFQPLRHSIGPVMDIGRPGTFDDNGVLVCSIIAETDTEFLMFYAGFELLEKIRYRIFIGLARSIDGGESFKRVSESPLLDRTNNELFFRAGPFVMKNVETYEMYYVGGSQWIELENTTKPVYTIRHTTSKDFKNWTAPVEVIGISSQSEHGFGRPFMTEIESKKYLYYSVRDSKSELYRIGYAEFVNDQFLRKDEDFELYNDFEQIENLDLMYAAFFESNREIYMLYNTSGFGLDGIHMAKLRNSKPSEPVE